MIGPVCQKGFGQTSFWICDGMECILLGSTKTTSEIGICLERYDIHKPCCRPFVFLYAHPVSWGEVMFCSSKNMQPSIMQR